MTANELTKEAIKTLNKNSAFVWRNNNLAVKGRTFIGLKGVPDIVGFTNQGVAVYCETKAIGDKLSTYQIAFLNLAKASKCLCYIATEENGNLSLNEYEPQ